MSEAQQAPAADINAIMTQAQVFASAWALIGSRHQGDELANAEEQRSQLRTMLANTIPDSYASKAQPVNQQMLAALKDISSDYADRFDLSSSSTNPGIKIVIEQARSAISAAEAAQPVGQDERAAFEKWFRREVGMPDFVDFDQTAPWAEFAFKAWSARAASAQPAAVQSEWRDAAATALRFIEGNAGHDQLCGVFDLDDEGRHKDCTCGMEDSAKKLHAMLSAAQRPDDEPNATQWWLASLDKYGNPKLEDGAHSERAGANQALYLINSLNLGAGKKFAVVKVQLFDAAPDSKGVNHEALATLSAAQIGGAA